MEKVLAGIAVAVALGVSGFVMVNGGTPGPQGERGPRGEQGVAGKDGVDGKNGRNGETVLGAATSEFRTLVNFFDDAYIGGTRVASSTSVSVTLAGSEFRTTKYLDYTTNVANLTLTLPASTTGMCASLPINQMRTVYIRHASTTVANSLTIAGGTGFILKKVATSTGSTIYGDSDGSSYAELKILRKANTDCVAFVEVYND